MDIHIILALALAGVLLLLIILCLVVRRTIIATIVGFSWQRKVFLEHFVWVQETSTWGYPKGSRHQHSAVEWYQSYEVIRYETQTTTVNGTTSTTTNPVYGFVSRSRTKYTYEIQRWLRSGEFQAEGEERATLHWPAYNLRANERVERTQEKYLALFQTAKGKTYRRELPEADWAALDDKATYTLKVNVFGHVMRVIPGAEQSAEMPEQTS